MTRYLISSDDAAVTFPEEDLPVVADASLQVVYADKDAGVWIFDGGLQCQTASIVTTDVPHFERILGEVTTVWMPESRFRVDDQVSEITGVEMDDAITVARNLVEYTTTDQFKQRSTELVRDSDRMFVHMKPMGPIERSESQ